MKGRAPLLPEIAGLAKATALLVRSARLREVSLVSEDGGRLTYLGEGESLPWLRRLYGCRVSGGRGRGLPAAGARVKAAREHGPVVLELDRLLSPLAPPGGAPALTWVRQEIRLAEGWKPPPVLEGVYGRAVRREGFAVRTTRDPAAVGEFHERLYLPYVNARFGDAVHPRCRGELHWAVRRGFVLQVLDGERWVSGVVCRVAGRRVVALAYGLAGDRDRELRRGALSAANYFLLRWAREHGMATVDLLRSRAHTADGVYEHKRRLGAQARPDPWPHTRLILYPPAGGDWPEVFRGHLAAAGPWAVRPAVGGG